MTTRSLLVLTLAVLTACGGDDGIHRLPDAPWLDGPVDSAPDAPGIDDVELGITLAGTGGGTISSSPAGIACGATCTSEFPRDTVVTLTAVPDTGSVFAGWSGACTGTVPTCEVTLANVASATATFNLATYTVTVTKSGAGTGTISGNGINCGSTCTVTVDHGTALSLSAAPGSLSTFAGWGGACTGTAACAFTVTADTTISASFALDDVTLFVTKGGTGMGTVTATGINCGTDCNETYSAGQMTTLTAVATTGSTFTGWTGATCTGTAPCTLTVTAAVTVTATFTLNTYALTVARTGSGSVTSVPAGIACGSACGATYNHGTSVTLTAMASTGWTFSGWGGGVCSGTGTCVVAMTAARSVTATFTIDQHLLSVARNGTGVGTVAGGPISCGTTCMASVDYDTVVTLTATPSTGSTFGGWGGACSGSGACTVTMNMARSVTATFTLNTYVLTVARDGTGAGNVTGSGISCGTDCTETIGHGGMLTLTATPTASSTFAGWAGPCSGLGVCAVTMDMAKTVTATFNINSYTLMVTKTGLGSVTATGISCGTDCTESFVHGTPVTLTANTPTGSTFGGWGGSCSGLGSCSVTMNMAHTVTAAWTVDQHTLTVTRIGNGVGTVTGTGISCGTNCTETVDYNTMITLTATPSIVEATRSKFVGWSGACSGLGTCTVTMTAAATVTATFDLAPNLIFVTSTLYNGALGGLAGADAKCQAHAMAANLPGTYVAYLSSINANTPIHAPSRVGTASGWERVDGRLVMKFISEFTGGALTNAPRLTELNGDVGATQFPNVWTATTSAGVYAGGVCSPAALFSPWNGTLGNTIIGDARSTTTTAVHWSTDGICNRVEYRLYCLGVDRAAF